QCSDQSSEKTASSKWFGSRPRSSSIRAASVSVSPRARWSGCPATWLVNEASLSASEDEPFLPDPALERVLRSAREPAPVARPAAQRERARRGVARVLVRITLAPIQVEAWVDLDEQRPARLVERPDREVLAKLRQEGDSAQRAGADLPRADELEDGLRPPAALELGPAEAGAGQLRLPRPPEGRLRVGEPRLPLARDELPRAGHLVDAAGPEEPLRQREREVEADDELRVARRLPEQMRDELLAAPAALEAAEASLDGFS